VRHVELKEGRRARTLLRERLLEDAIDKAAGHLKACLHSCMSINEQAKAAIFAPISDFSRTPIHIHRTSASPRASAAFAWKTLSILTPSGSQLSHQLLAHRANDLRDVASVCSSFSRESS